MNHDTCLIYYLNIGEILSVASWEDQRTPIFFNTITTNDLITLLNKYFDFDHKSGFEFMTNFAKEMRITDELYHQNLPYTF